MRSHGILLHVARRQSDTGGGRWRVDGRRRRRRRRHQSVHGEKESSITPRRRAAALDPRLPFRLRRRPGPRNRTTRPRAPTPPPPALVPPVVGGWLIIKLDLEAFRFTCVGRATGPFVNGKLVNGTYGFSTAVCARVARLYTTRGWRRRIPRECMCVILLLLLLCDAYSYTQHRV